MVGASENDRLVWIDCEMTGLDPVADALVEVAALVTDYELNVLGEGVDLIIRPPDEALAQMDDFVRDMHTSSGLLDVLSSGTTLQDAEQQVVDDRVRDAVDQPAVPRNEPLDAGAVLLDTDVRRREERQDRGTEDDQRRRGGDRETLEPARHAYSASVCAWYGP